VDDAAVVARLVTRDLLLAFEHHNARGGVPALERPSHGQPEDAGADDGEVARCNVDGAWTRAAQGGLSR